MLTLPEVYASLADWPKLIGDFATLHKKNLATVASTPDGHVSASFSEEQQQFITGIRCLTAACQVRDNAKYHKILTNLMVLASCLWWFGMVCEFNPSIFSVSNTGIIRVLKTSRQIKRRLWIAFNSRSPWYIC